MPMISPLRFIKMAPMAWEEGYKSTWKNFLLHEKVTMGHINGKHKVIRRL